MSTLMPFNSVLPTKPLKHVAALRGEKVAIMLRDANPSALVRELDSEACRQVVMPLRL